MLQSLTKLILIGILLAMSACGLAPQRSTSPSPSSISAGTLPALTNSLGMEFVHIPAGTFTMGSPETEIGRDQDERSYQVTLTKDFYLQRTEVTQGQWRTVMGHNPAHFLKCGDQCPIEQVSWEDVQIFIAKLNQIDPSLEYRLPTEAEWEYAARAGSTSALPNGELQGESGDALFHDDRLDEIGWYVGNSQQGTHPVGQKQANALGLFDMHGNVQEWVQDWHHSYPFNGVSDPADPEHGITKIRRGGSWNLYTRFCRSASRSWVFPTMDDPFTGLRLVAASKPVILVPAPVATATPEPTITSWEIYFDLDSAAITAPMTARLAEILPIVTESDKTLFLEGHTCDLAPDNYNQRLSERRVAAVKGFFLQHAIPEARIKSLAFGERNPAYPNDSLASRQHNRRVFLHLK